tara:strand:+ start:181 stop:372 length:192 start_codon:yes stop_codon:yes gene_type:complete
MGTVETMVVRDKQGNVTVINASEFDAKIHTKADGGGEKKAAPKAKKPKVNIRPENRVRFDRNG